MGSPRDASQVLTRVYEQYHGLLYSTALRLCGNEPDAEDAVNDAILRLSKHIDTIRLLDDAALTVYISATVRSVSADRRRRSETERRHVADVEPCVCADGGASLEDRYLEREARREQDLRLRETLAELRDADRDILLAKYYGGLDDRELARRLGIAEGSVRSRLSRAKARARKILRRKEGEADNG